MNRDRPCESPACIVIVPPDRERCHGCEGRFAGPLTVELLASYAAEHGEWWTVSDARYNGVAEYSGPSRIMSDAPALGCTPRVGALAIRSTDG